MDKIGILLLVCSSVTNALANSFLKVAFKGNGNMFESGFFSGLWSVATNLHAVTGAALFGISFLFFGSALARVNLSMGYPFMAGLAFLLIFLVSALFFKEQITLWGAAGAFAIMAGIILISVKG